MSDAPSHSLQGQFLVASPHLRDANFYRTVILLLEHSDEGAMGLVINRPSAVTIGKALGEEGPVNNADAPVFVGGPVEPGALFILHNCLAIAGTDREVVPGVLLAGSDVSFETLVRNSPSEPLDGNHKFRLLCGYAGWGEGQLESELARGDWHIQGPDGNLVLDEDPYGIWSVCFRRIQRCSGFFAHQAANPEWN